MGNEQCDDGSDDEIGCNSDCSGEGDLFKCQQLSANEPSQCCEKESEKYLKICTTESDINFTISIKNTTKKIITGITITQTVLAALTSFNSLA